MEDKLIEIIEGTFIENIFDFLSLSTSDVFGGLYVIIIVTIFIIISSYYLILSIHHSILYYTRSSSLFKDNQYFKCYKNIFQLYNKDVIINYDKKEDELTIKNLLNTDEYFYMNFSVSRFEPFEIFVTMANYFNANTTYNIILYGFKVQGINIVENNGKNSDTQNKKVNPEEFKKKKIYIPIIFINNVSKQELSKLPGINIAQAKRAIKYRSENNGFKTKEEFYKVTKLKQRYIEMIDKSIFIGKYNMLNEYQKEEIENPIQEGREVDF